MIRERDNVCDFRLKMEVYIDEKSDLKCGFALDRNPEGIYCLGLTKMGFQKSALYIGLGFLVNRLKIQALIQNPSQALQLLLVVEPSLIEDPF